MWLVQKNSGFIERTKYKGRNMKVLLFFSIFLTLSSCSVGSAASAYSLMSIQADSLSKTAEKDLICKIKFEIEQEQKQTHVEEQKEIELMPVNL
jgi:hypothetical protein